MSTSAATYNYLRLPVQTLAQLSNRQLRSLKNPVVAMDLSPDFYCGRGLDMDQVPFAPYLADLPIFPLITQLF